jgi:hypothetical protein
MFVGAQCGGPRRRSSSACRRSQDRASLKSSGSVPGVGERAIKRARFELAGRHVVAGTRLIDDLGGRHVRLKRVGTSRSAMATHLRYAIVGPPDQPPGRSMPKSTGSLRGRARCSRAACRVHDGRLSTGARHRSQLDRGPRNGCWGAPAGHADPRGPVEVAFTCKPRPMVGPMAEISYPLFAVIQGVLPLNPH